ncbi:MAG: K+/H+ antiporter subunit F [Saezia sp.]
MMPMMTGVVIITLLCYALAMLIATYRLFAGPASQDRILAADFIYIVGMLSVLVLGIYYNSAVYYEMAFIMALFGFVSSICMAKFLIRGEVIE